MPQGWTETDIDAIDVRLHLRRFNAGAPAAKPLLLLHGLGASGAVWQSFARRLSGWGSIAPDLRGHGTSDHPASGYEPQMYARDLLALLDRLEIQALPVVGHSLGALVALAMADLAPQRVARLALLDPPVDPERTNPDVPEVYRLRHAPGDALERYLAADGGSVFVARAMAPVFRQAADAAYEAYLNGPRNTSWAWDVAPHISAPTLVVQADPQQGGVLSDEAADAFVTRLPQGHLVKLPGASHAVHATRPAETAAAILELLREPG